MQENAYLLDGRGGPKGQMSKTLMGKEVMKPMWDSGKQPESAGGRAGGGLREGSWRGTQVPQVHTIKAYWVPLNGGCWEGHTVHYLAPEPHPVFKRTK